MKHKSIAIVVSIVLALSLWGLIPAPEVRAATCTATTTGNWSAITWSGCSSGPSTTDDVTINTGVTITVDTNATIASLTLLGGASGTRLTINNGIVLTVNGTLSSDVTATSATLINGAGTLRFTGTSRALFGSSWGGNPQSWNLEIALDAGAVGTASTNVKAGRILVSSGTFSTTGDLRPDAASANTGTLSVASGAKLIARNISRTATLTAQCSSINITGTLEVSGSNISALNINIANGGTLRVTRAAGLTVTGALAYTTGSTLEYAGTVAQTTSQELPANIYNVTIANPAGVTLTSNTNVTGTVLVNANTAFNANGNSVTAGTLTNNGTLTQTLSVTGSSDVFFFNTGGYGGVTVNANNTGSGVDLGNTVVAIRGNRNCDASNSSVRRCFDINPATKLGVSAIITFYFANGDLGTQICANLKVWHWAGAAWASAGTSAAPDCASTPNSIQVTGVASFSPFALSDGISGPTAITLRQIDARSSELPLAAFIFAFGLLIAAGGLLALHRRKA